MKPSEPEFKSYEDSLDGDLQELEKSQELALSRKHEIHVKRLNNFKFVSSRFGIIAGIVLIIVLATFFIHKGAVVHYKHVRENSQYWISQCEGAGGKVLYNNVKRYQDNVCAFPNGFSVPRAYTNSQ